jgi:hypothetical protein
LVQDVQQDSSYNSTIISIIIIVVIVATPKDHCILQKKGRI